MGSPTEPSRPKVLRDVAFTGSSPSDISARIGVGAVYSVFTLYLSTICQMREAVGNGVILRTIRWSRHWITDHKQYNYDQ